MIVLFRFRSLQGSTLDPFEDNTLTEQVYSYASLRCSNKNLSCLFIKLFLWAIESHSICVGATALPLLTFSYICSLEHMLLLCVSTVLSSWPATLDISQGALYTSIGGALMICWYLNVDNTCRIFAMICSTQAFDSCEKVLNTWDRLHIRLQKQWFLN